MKQRLITVPKDKSTEQLLNYNEAANEQLIELSLSEEEFYLLWREKIFDLINESGDSNIDDYEDDNVVGQENIKKVIDALKSKEISSDTVLNKLVVSIRELFEEALNRDTGVYFYF